MPGEVLGSVWLAPGLEAMDISSQAMRGAGILTTCKLTWHSPAVASLGSGLPRSQV